MVPLMMVVSFFSKRGMNYLTYVLYFLILLIHLILSSYFFKAKVPLGSDLFAYSMEEIMTTIKAGAGFSYYLLFLFLFSLVTFVLLVYRMNQHSKIFFRKRKVFIMVSLVLFGLVFLLKKEKISSIGAYGNYIAMNKTYFFAENILKQFGMGKEIPEFEDDKSYYFSSADDTSVKIIDPAYPFYKHTIAGNPLQPFFKPLIKNKPNLVFIILEGMGSDFLGKHAKMADFSPFLDSLSQKSLFWENTLSAGGRTFAALPSIFGSLPFLRQGFLEEGETRQNQIHFLVF